MSALREALFGNADEARRRAALAIERSTAVDVRYGAALALTYAGDEGRAQALTNDLEMMFPENTAWMFSYLPTLRAKLAVSRGNASEALESLKAAAPYELGQMTAFTYPWTAMYPVYVRGEAYLAAHQGLEAAAEFQKILDHRGIVVIEPIGALAHLDIGRAYAMQGDTQSQGGLSGFPRTLERRRPRHPHPHRCEGRAREARSSFAKPVCGSA